MNIINSDKNATDQILILKNNDNLGILIVLLILTLILDINMAYRNKRSNTLAGLIIIIIGNNSPNIPSDWISIDSVHWTHIPLGSTTSSLITPHVNTTTLTQWQVYSKGIPTTGYNIQDYSSNIKYNPNIIPKSCHNHTSI